MVKVIFKNLEKSELVQEAVTERLETVLDKFPDLRASRIAVTLEMENSPLKSGPDLFNVTVHVGGGRYKDVRIKKSAPNLYVALADLVDHMLEKLNRFGDRSRIKERNHARELLNQLDPKLNDAKKSS